MRTILFVGLGIFYFLGCLQANDTFSLFNEEEIVLNAQLESRHSSDSEKKKRFCHRRGKRGKEGPTGPTGSIGPKDPLVGNYASFFGTDVITVSGPLSFPMEQVDPVGIDPNGDFTIFTISSAGSYSIQWSVTANLAGNQSIAAVSLLLLVNGSTINPAAIGEALNQFPASSTTLIQTVTIAGQTTISTTGPNQTVQMNAIIQTQPGGNSTVTNRTFSITQIAQ